MNISARGIAAGLAIGMVAVSGAAFASGAVHAAHPTTGVDPVTRPVPASVRATRSPEAQLTHAADRTEVHATERSSESTGSHDPVHADEAHAIADAAKSHDPAYHDEAHLTADAIGSHDPVHADEAGEHAADCEPVDGTGHADQQSSAAPSPVAAADDGSSHDTTHRDSDTSVEQSHHQGDHR